MQRKDLALRVLSTAAIMSIVTSIAAPAFAGTYYMENGNLSIRQDENGNVWVKSGDSAEKQDTDDEVIIHGGAGENQWSNAPSGGAAATAGTEDSAAGEGTPPATGNSEDGSAPAAATGTEDSAAGEGTPPATGNSEGGSAPAAATGTEGSVAGEGASAAGNNAEGGSAPTAATGTEGSVAGEGASAAGNNAEGGSAPTAATGTEGSAAGEGASAAGNNAREDSAQTQQGKDNTKEEDTPKDPSTEPAPTTSADPEEKTLKTTQADTTTTPAAEEPSTKLEDVTVDTAYQPVAPTSTASSNWISVVNNCLGKVLNIRLSNVNIKKTSNDDTAPMTVDGSGSTTIELDGNNVLDASTPAWNHTAGLEKKGAGTLTITDTDSITAKDGTTQDNTRRGSLTATGGHGSSGGAGIGSRGTGSASIHNQTENITIKGNAYVKAYGQGNASGIGGGYGGNAKNITIEDNAYVVAKGGGAGIGSGISGGSSDVKIQGGTVVAEGSYTGIGGHCRGSDTSETSTIEISGGTVYANGLYGADGVSIGSVGGNSEITISGNAKVKNIGQMGSYGTSKAEAEKINATITIEDNAMIADGSGGIGGNTNTNITIQDNAVIGNLLKFEHRPNEWFGYIGTCTGTSDRIYNAKATVQIKDNVLIKDVAFIGGKYITSDVKIKIQDNAHIKKIDASGCNVPAIGSDGGKVDVTIGGSSDPNKPQQGTVRIDEARSVANPGAGHLAVIGSASGGGTVSIERNVQLGLVSKGVDYNRVDYVKGNSVMTLDEMKNSIRGDSTMSLKNEQTGNLEYIVHGQNVCAHVAGEETDRQEATCTTEGFIEYKCNYEAQNGATGNSCNRTWRVTLPKKDHDYGPWTVKTPATCEGEGEEHRTCYMCHKEETKTIPALDHLWKEDHRTGNCGVAGDIYYVCERDNSHTKTEPVAATGNHQFKDWHQTKAPTCMEEGEEQHECEVCGKPETRKVDKLDHVEELRGAKEPTCTEPGYTGDKWCTRGDHLLEKGSVIPATGHQKTHIEGKKEPTCTEPGYTGDEVCDACGTVVKKGTVIPATGHHWVDNGDGTHTCTNCGATEGQPVNTNSALELRVVDAEGMDRPFTVSQNGTLRTYTGAYDTATLTGDLNTLCYLQEHGAQTIQFVTNGQTSSFAISDLLAQGSGSEVFYLTHRGAEEPTLLLVEADHSDLL